jgi:two-component system NarL family sensor kinase
MLSKKSTIFFIIFFCLFFLNACKEEKKNEVVFEKKIENEDATKLWLRKNENYNNSNNYLIVFNNYYNKKLNEKNYLDAAGILDVVSTKLAFFYDFNEPFLATVKEFDAKYRKKAPVLKTTFVDSYLANYYYDKGEFKKSCVYFKKITLLEPNDYKSCYKIARANYELAYVYYGMGKQNLSLQANFQSLKYFNKINDIEELGSVYSNYTNIYRAIKNKKKAVESINKAIQCFVKTGNNYDIYMGLYNKICTYEDFSDSRTSQLIDSVMITFDKSKYDSDVLKIAFSDWKVLYLLREYKFDEAKKILDDLKPLVKKVNSDNWTQDYDATVAEYEAMSNPKNANIDSIKTAIPLLKNNRQYEKLSLFYNVLKKHEIKKNNFKNALAYEEQIRNVNDSMGNIAMQEKIIELETKYQTKKKEQQIKLQNTEILNKNITIALLASLFLGLFLIAVVYVNRQKQKKLQLQKDNTQQYTKQLLEKTEEERKRIASDLHDSVSHELLSLRNSFEQKTDATNNKIDAIINDIRIISRNLHPIMFDKIGLKASIEQLVERTQSVNDFLVTADIIYTNFLSTNDELQLYRIIQEALSNVIKYANAVAAKITILEQNESLFVEIKDNGKGFNIAETMNGKNAFGLHNIIERSRAINGEAKINSDKKGTIINIEIKKRP